MPVDRRSLDALASALASADPRDILRRALEEFGPDAAISFSGAEDVVLIHMAGTLGLPFSVFTLDTGRLHPETYRFLDTVRTRYGITLDVLAPQAHAVERLVREKGFFSFLTDGHKECCGIRKVEPLRRALAGRRAWITGQRRDQSPGTRGHVPVVELDTTFGTATEPLVKWNPLAHWTSTQVWHYIVDYEVPFNPLHGRGFKSIGCEPCTRAVHPGEHERAGRWWWEEETKKECGLHLGPAHAE